VDSVVWCDVVVSGVFGCYSNCVWVDDVDVDGVGEYGVELRCSIFHLVLVVQDSRARGRRKCSEQSSSQTRHGVDDSTTLGNQLRTDFDAKTDRKKKGLLGFLFLLCHGDEVVYRYGW